METKFKVTNKKEPVKMERDEIVWVLQKVSKEIGFDLHFNGEIDITGDSANKEIHFYGGKK